MCKLWNCAVGATVAIGILVGDARAQTPIKLSIGAGVDPVFAQFYIAKESGIFLRNGLEVDVRTGSSGSAMIPFLIGNNVQAAYGSDLAGVINHNLDQNIVAVADGVSQDRWQSIVGRNIADIEGLKGKRIGITKGTSGEIFWSAVVEKFKLNPKNYTFVNIEAPEEIAAMERGDIDAFVAWEPWPTRAIRSIKGAKILIDAEGIVSQRAYIFMYRPWIEQNPDAAERFMRSLVEADDFIKKDPEASAEMISKFLQMPISLTKELMPKVEYHMLWSDGSLQNIQAAIKTLTEQGKMKAPLDWNKYVYLDLLRKFRPNAIQISKLPP